MAKGISRLVKAMVSNGIVEEGNEELYEYGLYVGVILAFNVVSAFIIAFSIGMVWECVAVLTTYISLRTYAGGYHAGSQVKCYVYSMIAIAIQLYLVKMEWAVSLLYIALSGSVLLVMILSPVESENKPLNEKERRKYAKRARMIAAAAIVATVVLIGAGQHQFAKSIVVGIATVALLMVKEKKGKQFFKI